MAEKRLFGGQIVQTDADGGHRMEVILAGADGGTGAVGLGAGEAHLGQIGGQIAVVTATELTRPGNTTAYTANDAVNNDATTPTLLAFTNLMRVTGGSGYITGARLVTDKKSITPRFRVHLFNASDPTIAGDNLAWKDLYADQAKRLGFFDLPAMTTAADTSNSTMSRTLDMALRIPIVAATGTRTIWAALETLDAFTPADSQKFLLSLAADLN